MPRQGPGPRVLPFIRDLNPQRDDFVGLIQLVKKHEGNREDLVRAIEKKWEADQNRKGFSTHSIDSNTVTSLGEQNLGIVDHSCTLTPLGRKLYRARNDLDKFKDVLGAHLLKNRSGWQFARALDVLNRRGRRPKRAEVAEYLASKYGIQEWRDHNNISALHGFLGWCGVVKRYALVSGEFKRLLGASTEDLAALEGFPIDTRAYLEGLVRLGGSATAREMREAAEAYLRRRLDVHELPSRVQPLVDAGWVEPTTKRGDRTGRYAVVDEERAALLAEVAGSLASIGAVPDEVFDKDFEWVMEQLEAEGLTKDERGRSLEILAAMICWRLGLRHLLLREKSEYEVDVLAEYVGSGGYQSWSAQCKAYGSGSVRSEHILREFGIATLDHYSVLLFVTTSNFTRDAVDTAEKIVERSAVQVVLLDGRDLKEVAESETKLFSKFAEQAEHARRLRYGDPPWMIFRELDAIRDWILEEKPSSRDLWLHLERRDLMTTEERIAAIHRVWLESQKGSKDFDEAYWREVGSIRG